MTQRLQIIAAVFVAVLMLILSTAYTVDQREKAIKLQFREIKETDITPGLHFKLPFIQSIQKFPGQILTFSTQSERFLTSEKKYVLVDFYVQWRIDKVATFYTATAGGSLEYATNRLENIMKDGLRNEFSRRTIEQALSEQRDEIMKGLEQKSNEAASQLGISIVDVRVSKIDFPNEVSKSVYERMSSERNRVAQDFRSRGQAAAEKIKATADRTATVLMAEAYRDAEKIRGEGDAKAAEIYANAYQSNGEFYTFYRSLDVYRKTMGQTQNTTMVLDPNSDFFRYFKSAGKGTTSPTSVQPAQQPTAASQAVPAP
ncbi:protease modulator HflC [Thiolinea disciformis]|uniref:protease modulator HflC n=1 Tax=Thiolinea disciformis TaxID=125614 RepID=UPI0003606290|nr:protease modulator HflC [Thiolinea disciformis]